MFRLETQLVAKRLPSATMVLISIKYQENENFIKVILWTVLMQVLVIFPLLMGQA